MRSTRRRAKRAWLRTSQFAEKLSEDARARNANGGANETAENIDGWRRFCSRPTGLHLDADEPRLTFTKNNSMKLKFYGTRGSIPICDAGFQQFGGNTTCLQITFTD